MCSASSVPSGLRHCAFYTAGNLIGVLDIFFPFDSLVLGSTRRTQHAQLPDSSSLHTFGSISQDTVCPAVRPFSSTHCFLGDVISNCIQKGEEVIILWSCQKLALLPPSLPSCVFSGRWVALCHEASGICQPLFLQPSFFGLTAYRTFSGILLGIRAYHSVLVFHIGMSFHPTPTHHSIVFYVCVVLVGYRSREAALVAVRKMPF